MPSTVCSRLATACGKRGGYDISNITFIDTADGWLIIDPLTTEPTAAACLALANETLGERPVSAVIYTHSHVDHYGGILGVTSREAVDAGNCRIIAPEGFLTEAVSENGTAGPIMMRRAIHQFGVLLPHRPHRQSQYWLGCRHADRQAQPGCANRDGL